MFYKSILLAGMIFMALAESGLAAEKLHLYRLPYPGAEDKFYENSSQLFYLPLKTRRAVMAPAHQRWKPENFSAKVYTAWNSRGLMIAFTVRDRQAHNNAVLAKLWSEDCLEIFLDLRKKPEADYDGDAVHFVVAPPIAGTSEGRFYVVNERDMGKDFSAVSYLLPDGWGGKIFVPWSAFPEFEAVPGSELGLGLQISDDYGRPNNNPFFFAQYLTFCKGRMANNAHNLHRWVLSEKFAPSAENDLANVMAVDVPNLMFSGQVNANIVMAEAFAKMASGIDWECVIADRKISGTAAPDKLSFTLPAGVYGRGTVKLKVYDAQKQLLGVLNLPFERFNGEALQQLQQDVSSLLKTTDLSKLAKDFPGKVADYFGLLNNVEQLKRMIFLEKTSDIDLLVDEINLRMQLLQNKTLQTENNLFKLLQISADQDAQLSVEYPRYHPDNKRRNDALIKFYSGSVPLARVRVTVNEKSAADRRKWIPAVYRREIIPTENKEHLLFFFTVGGSHNKSYWTNAKSLDGVRNIDAAVIADNAPADHAQAVREYAAKHKLPIVKEADLNKGMQVLYAGRPEKSSAIGKLLDKTFKLVWTTAGRNDMVLELADGLIANIRCISAAGCELIADALTARRPFTRQENVLLAKLVAAELAKSSVKPCSIPDNCDIMAADVHCHSIYSDGLLTPLGVLAAALYSQMDFLFITDHETAAGVLTLQQKLQASGFKFPLIAGEESSLPDGHLNSYPLTESIPFGLSFEKLIQAAHAQGALVQYNHPATYSNRRDLQLNGIAGSGLEAWEHEMPPYAKNWAEIPAQIGSSDNHNSAFPTERTLTYAASMDGNVFKNAVRRKQTAMIDAVSEEFIYGPDNLKGMLITALQEPEKYLHTPHYRRLQKFLNNADIAGLFNSMPGYTPIECGLE